MSLGSTVGCVVIVVPVFPEVLLDESLEDVLSVEFPLSPEPQIQESSLLKLRPPSIAGAGGLVMS